MAANGGGQQYSGRNGHVSVRNGGQNLARILQEMSRPGLSLEKRRDGDRSLREYVEAEARDLSGQPFSLFMTNLYGTIQSHISRSAWHIVVWPMSPAHLYWLVVYAVLTRMRGLEVCCPLMNSSMPR